MRRLMKHFSACTVVALTTFGTGTALAQDGQFCIGTEALQQPSRQVVECGDAIRIERETSTQITVKERASDAAPREIELKKGAILIDVTPGSAPTQVRTPHALATVRGTTYIVDAGADSTAVFVLEGRVAVQRANDASTVTLDAGKGADVTLSGPMDVQTWGDARVQALLARFGR